MTDVVHMNIKEFRSAGYLQEVNRRFLHPLGLALEVTIMDGDSDDEKMIDRIAPLVVGVLEDRARRGLSATTTATPGDIYKEIAGEVAGVIVAEMWPRGSEHISGVWDYRDDPEGIVFGAGEIDVNKTDDIEVLFARRLARRAEILGFGVQGPADQVVDERSGP